MSTITDTKEINIKTGSIKCYNYFCPPPPPIYSYRLCLAGAGVDGEGGMWAGAGRGGIDYLVHFALVGPGVNNSFKTCYLPLRFPVSVERRVAGRKPSLTLWKTGSIDYPLPPFPR